MKAIIYKEYGSPDVLQYVDVDKPIPDDNQVLVKIYAAGTNPLDWHLMRGEPFIARLDAGWSKPKNHKLGADIAGVIEAVGKNITKFQAGDEVFGEIWKSGFGGFAEYVCVTEEELELKPQNVTFEEAGSTGVVGFTAIQGLRDTGHIQASQKVLINGASGGVGTFAVQYAKSVGAHVTGVCSTRNLEMVRSIGADEVIDYTQGDFTRSGQQFDLIYDAVGNLSIADMRRALAPDGRGVVAGFTTLPLLFQIMLFGPLVSKFISQNIGMMGTAQANSDDLRLIKELLAAGKIKPVIDRSYPLSETAEAIRYLETMRARGKVIVTMQ